MSDPAPGPLPLDPDERAGLLKLARQTIEQYLCTRRRPAPKDLGIPITPGMRAIAGAFVTLHKQGLLRGCIGEIVPSRALHVAVQDQALNAALKDPRFPPVTAGEMKDIVIEISALSEPWPLPSWEDIVLGRHGIILRHGHQAAVFLPQVAPEQGWTREETLTHLALKAGLPPDAWRDEEARFEVFEATVFREP